MNKEIEKLSEESTETREFTEDEINVYGLCDTHAKTAYAFPFFRRICTIWLLKSRRSGIYNHGYCRNSESGNEG